MRATASGADRCEREKGGGMVMSAPPLPEMPKIPPVRRPGPPIGPIDGADQLPGALMRSLSRPSSLRLGWSVVKTGALGFFSFGLLPILAWGGGLSDLIRFERTQFWHLAEWLRLQTGHPDAVALCEQANAMRTRTPLSIAALLWALSGMGVVVSQVGFGIPFLPRVIDATYGVHLLPLATMLASSSAFAFLAWTVGLSMAYLLHWLRLQLHAADARRFIERFNKIAEWEGVSPVKPRRIGPGVGPLWVIAAFLFASTNALWGVPLMLAGSAQRRYITRSGAANRAALAERVSHMIDLRRPPIPRAAISLGSRSECRELLCRMELPPGAHFCPRCGTRVTTIWRDAM
jgi:hypothetical protein